MQVTPSLRADDATWTNIGGSFLWNLSAPNWAGGTWNNVRGDGAIFGAAGAGVIDVTDPINVNSLSFTANGYSLGGSGALTFVNGSSSLGTGFINVDSGVTASIGTAIHSSLGLFKFGAGTLELPGPLNFSGAGFALIPGRINTDIFVAGISEISQGGTLRIMNGSVLPATTRMAISNGLVDLGSNNVTLGSLTFLNQADFTAFNPATNSAGVGVIGTGTLRVTGEINVLGASSGASGSNTIAANLDLGGGTQVIRVGGNGAFTGFRALQITGAISNGSILKTTGLTLGGGTAVSDGLALYGNNTYAGSTTLNGGSNVMTGTNATTSVLIQGPNGPQGNSLTLMGANGSLGGATVIQASGGGQFAIDNNTALPAGGDTPTIAAAQNNNRIRDDAEIRLRDGSFLYRGRAATAASETFGNLAVTGGHSTVQMFPGASGGTATLTASGNLTLGARSTLLISTATVGGTSRFFVNGTLPAADATGILNRVVSTNDFLTYNSTTGMTPYTGYAADFSTAGTNVALTAAATVASSVNVNALKRTGSSTVTIGAGQTLGIASGMILQTSGTGTYTGGTIAFGSNPGVLFGGSHIFNSAITGTSGLIATAGTNQLNGDLSGLSGTITVGAGTTTLGTNTFGGNLEVRAGTLSINTSQTLAGQGSITLGVPENNANLIGSLQTLSFTAAGANAVIARDIIVNNGAQNLLGEEFRFSLLPSLSPLGNESGSQTLSGNILLNSPLRIQGGGGGGTGATILSGNLSGPAAFFLTNGRVVFSGNVGHAGGFRIGEGGFTAQAIFAGTVTGAAPINVQSGNNTSVAYQPGSLPTGAITVENPSGATGFVATLVPLANSTIDNTINLNGIGGGANVGAGLTANWNGTLNGTFGFNKFGTGTLVLGHAANTFTGAVTVSAGTLLVQGSLPASSVAVADGGTFGGNGTVPASLNIASGGTLAPGSSIGTFGTGSVTLAGVLQSEIDLNHGGVASADLLRVTGDLNINSGTLALALSNLPLSGATEYTFLLAENDGTDAINGTFGLLSGLPAGYAATLDYAFSGTDSLGRFGTGNDLAIHLTVPEPSTFVLITLGAAGFGLLARRRRTA